MQDHQDDLKNNPPKSRAQDRRGSVWSACDVLADQGVKPTLSKIRPLHRGGSDTDVQADIQAWFSELFKRHRAQAEGFGLPNDVAALMRELWGAAQSSADAQLQAQRDELETQREEWSRDTESALRQRDESNARANNLDRDLAAEREKTSGQARLIADIEIRLGEALSEIRQERSRAERLVAEMSANETRHSEAMWQLREESGEQFHALREAHAQELSIERAARSEEVLAVREQLRQRGAHYDQELKLSEERLRAVEKRLMLDQDSVRHSVAEWKRKAQEERDAGDIKVSAVRRQMEAMVADAASLRAHLSASEVATKSAQEAAEKAQSELARLAMAIAHGKDVAPALGTPPR